MFDDKLTLIVGGKKLMLSRGAFNDSPDVLPENNFFGSKKNIIIVSHTILSKKHDI